MKEMIRQPNSALVMKMIEVALAFLKDSLDKNSRKQIEDALEPFVVKTQSKWILIQQATMKGTEEVGKKVAAKETAKEVAEEVGKRVSIKTAAKLAKESTSGVFRRALVMGAVVDGVVCAYEVVRSAKKYDDGKISGHEFGCNTVRSVSSAVGSTLAGAAGAVAGTFVGGFLGSIVPEVGTAVGATVGGFIGSVVAGTAGSIGGAKAGEYVGQAIFYEK